MGEWKEIKASEYCLTVTDGTHDSPKPQNEGKPLVTSKHIKNNTLDLSDAYLITQEDYDKIVKRSYVSQWDVIISMIGAYCGFCYLQSSSFTSYAVKNVGLFKVGDEIKSKWLYYYLNSPKGKEQLFKARRGSSQPYLSLNSLRNLIIPTPSYLEQKRIVSILSSLDEKIETNRKINARLEELAQAIFKSWFIDFEPFGGKMPEDWANFKVGEVSTINERQYSLHENWTDFQYLDTGNITENIIGKLYKFSNNNDLPSRARRKVKEFDIIYSTVRPNQRHFGLILNPDKNWLVSTGFAVISAKQSYINSFYLYMVISQKKVSEYLQSLGEQATSTYPSVNATDIANLEIMVPDLELQNQFGLIISKIFQLKNTLEQESSRLAALRDTLLPKLMSGELLPE